VKNLGRTIGERAARTDSHLCAGSQGNAGCRTPDQKLWLTFEHRFSESEPRRRSMGYVLDKLPEPLPFPAAAKPGAFQTRYVFTYNMGIGFCIVIAPEDADAAHSIARKHNSRSFSIGYTVKDPEKKVVPPIGKLVGADDKFSRQ